MFTLSSSRRSCRPLQTLRLVTVIAVCQLIALEAAADGASTAHALFEAGATARDAGDFKTACEKFEASQKLDPAPGTTLNIADCREQLGQLAQAWQHYSEAAERLPKTDLRAEYASAKASELRPRLPLVTVAWEGPNPDAEVSVDGVTLPPSALGLALPTDPGRHLYIVRATGHEEARFEVEVSEGQKRTVRIFVGPTLAPEPAVPLEPSRGSSTNGDAVQESTKDDSWSKSTLGWIGIGVGSAALITGGVTGLLAMDKAKLVRNECDDDFCMTNKGKKAADAGRTLATMSTASFIVGGILAATGISLVILDSKSEPSAQRHLPGAPLRGTQVQLVVTASQGSAGMNLAGEF